MLYVVATPIGNLQDITLRALDILKGVDKIYCEDTRRTRDLLKSFGIEKPTDSYHHHSDERKVKLIVSELRSGLDLAYVTDSGTPGVADPAGKLVKACRSAGIEISPIPGVSSVTALLSVSGVLANSYHFAGYIPTKKGRQTFLKQILDLTEPVVFFETAPRFLKLLDLLVDLGAANRTLVVGRELTKKFEQVVAGTPLELKDSIDSPRGEFVLVLTPEDKS